MVCALVVILGSSAVLSVGCLVSDHLFPRIPAVERMLRELPLWERKREVE